MSFYFTFRHNDKYPGLQIPTHCGRRDSYREIPVILCPCQQPLQPAILIGLLLHTLPMATCSNILGWLSPPALSIQVGDVLAGSMVQVVTTFMFFAPFLSVLIIEKCNSIESVVLRTIA